VELLVALSVIGLILVLAMPNFHTMLTGRQLDGSARLLRDAMTEARSRAIARQIPTAVTLDLRNNAFRVDGSGQWTGLGEDLHIEFTAALSETVTDELGRVRFLPEGASTGATILLSEGGQSYRLSVDWLTGRARLRPLEAESP
jgi:general secretion pathway protein H